MSGLRRLLDRLVLPYLAFGLIAVCVLRKTELLRFDPSRWADVSAWALALIGVGLMLGIDDRFDNMLDRLAARGSLDDSERLDALRTKISNGADIVTLVGGVALPAILVATYFMLDRFEGFVIVEAGAAFIIGALSARAVWYGFLGSMLRRNGIGLKVRPGHPDGAGGLRPVGEFYLRIAGITMLPAVFLAFWWLVIPVWDRLLPSAWPGDIQGFAEWRDMYLVFLVIAVTVEVLVFVLPMMTFHSEMMKQKNRELLAADQLSTGIIEMKAKLAQEDDSNRLALLNEQLSRKTERYGLIEELPTWPIDTRLGRRFAMKNLLVLTPVIIDPLRKLFPWLNALIPGGG